MLYLSHTCLRLPTDRAHSWEDAAWIYSRSQELGVPHMAGSSVPLYWRIPHPSVSAEAPEFMAAVLEVVASQVLQRAGDAAAASSSGRIEPHHIRVAVRKDEDLTRLVGEDALEEGGLLRPPAADDADA